MKILKKIDGLFITPVSDGADLQNKILGEHLPFKIHQYDSGSEHNGWIVPDKWEVIKGEIRQNGRLVYDGKKHPLGVIGNSKSFSGKVSLEELKKHLFYKKDSPENIVYHCDYYYKPHLADWGFSLPYKVFKGLKPGEYEINLATKHIRGKMKVLEYEHKGRRKEIIILNAHNCHAAQLNDGPAGYAVFIEVMKKLKTRKTKFNYRLIIAPEHIGTAFYLSRLGSKEINNLTGGIFMEMVGHDNPVFALQESFTGESLMDKIAHHVLKFKYKKYRSDKYRKVVGNDESVWEAPGIEMPMISLSRCARKDLYYKEYHLDSDNLKIMDEKRLAEAEELIMEIIDVLEKNCRLKRKFTGLIALSNPRYDLYISPGTDPSLKFKDKEDHSRWYNLMDRLPRYFDGNTSILDIAVKHDLSFNQVYDYILKFREKGLVDFID